ncbi:defensin [Episyrphus balteatus]|uniref:defensin n=1 Tax=Episyrphus balteatus TaxID=286459 RepID=UPI00248694F0|nr:defensin [Episyrphus balteatus]
MRASIVFVVIFGFVCALSSALPVADPLEATELEFAEQTDSEAAEVGEAPIRQKRATCDLLSIFNVNHTACAAHCLAKGFKGGYCNGKKVCVCRR